MSATAIANLLNFIQAGLNWLASRGLARDRIQKILDDAHGSDITSAQVQAELDALASELDTTEGMINQ